MKKILLLLIASVAICAACNSDDEPTRNTKGQLDPNALVTVSPAQGVKVRAVGDADSDTAYSALDVMLRARGVAFHSRYEGSSLVYDKEYYAIVAFGAKDTANAKLRFWSTQIISDRGELLKGLLYGRDFVIIGGDPNHPNFWTQTNDTLGYIPNAVVREARAKIEAAYNDSNYTEVYRLFDEAFTYYPCTAKQYKELKAKGLN